jgi:hypothetical protein
VRSLASRNLSEARSLQVSKQFANFPGHGPPNVQLDDSRCPGRVEDAHLRGPFATTTKLSGRGHESR